MANDVVFVNPEWINIPGGTPVYITEDEVYRSDPPSGSTAATCYSTFKEAVTGSSSGGTIYIYNSTASPLSLAAPSGEYSQQLSSAFFIEKNLYVRAGIFQVGSVEHSTYSFNIIDAYTVDFGVTESFNIAQNTVFNVWNGANFQLGSTGNSSSVSFENSGTVCVSNGATFQAGTTSITNNVEIEVTGSAFSVASVTNTGDGTFKVEGTSKLEIGNLSGTITLNKENVTLNASNITGGSLSATSYGAIFTGANTLNGVALNATGKTVTVNGTLTVKGTSSLKIGTLSGTIKTDANELTTLTDSSITNGTISVQNSLAFTEANTLNGITLDATGKTVTVGTDEGDSLTVDGTSTLNIGNLNGEIKTAANTTLQNSNITGGSITTLGLVSVTVKNSTISSNVFTTTESGVDFSGACILDGVNLDTGNNHSVNVSSNDTLTISGGTLSTGSLYGNGTVTVMGENELHIGNLYGDGIKLDGATIKNSSIAGMYKGGTLLVESGKTATFSGTNTMSATSISNSGTINVNGRLTTGAITNTNGTIALNGGATVSSAISGGSITTSNTGTVTVQYSTISSSAFTATADEVIFYHRNTLNGVTLDATGKAVTVNGTLTVKGTSTLNATNITGGTISAQDNLTFTGTNTLKNGVTLDATGNTVTIGNDDEIADSLTVKGTNTLNIGTLVGTIKTDANALTTLNASSITGGSISAQNNLTFTGANTLNSVTLDAMVANKTVTIGTGEGDSLTVGGTSSTLNIGTLDGEIKTDSAGTTLNASSITGGGTNGGTITALGDLTFAGKNFLNDGVTLNAAGKTVTVDTLWVEGTSTLNIGTLNGVIRTDVATTFSNSTISGGNGGLYIYENTDVTFAGENQVNAACWWTSFGHHSSIINGNNGLITVKSIPASRDNPNALDYVPAQRGVLKTVDIWNNGSITVGNADAENADACSIEVTNLTNNNNLTVACIAESANPSRLKATEGIVNNGDMTLTNSELSADTVTNKGNGDMTLTNSVLNATMLENYAPGIFDPGPPTSQAAITISNSTVSLVTNEGTGSLTNGSSDKTKATVEFNNSTVTVDSVTNYGTHNGTDGNTGKVGFAVTDCTFTVNNTLTNYGWIYVISSTLQAASVVNNGNRFWVYGTSTLDIDSLEGEGTITIGKHTGYEDPVTLNNSLITGKVNDNGTLGSSISVTNPLTFTGANTLTNVALATTNYGAVTVGNDDAIDDSLTAGGTLSFNGNLNVASNASLAVGDGAKMTVTGNISNNGSITVTGTGSLSVANIINSNDNSNDNNGTITIEAGSTVKVTGGSSSISGGTLNIVTKHGETSILTDDFYVVVNGTIANSVTITVDGSGSYDSSSISGYELTTIDGALCLKKDGAASVLHISSDYAGLADGTLTEDGHLVGYNAFSSAEAAAVVAAESGATVDVENGTYTEITELRGARTVIQEGPGTTEFNRAVYGGTKVDAAGSASRNTDASIETGTFDRFFVGGNNIAMPTTGTSYTVSAPEGKKQSVRISGGVFNAIVAAGDRVQKGEFTLNSDLETTISGGQFNLCVAGGLLNSLYSDAANNGEAIINGNISLTVTGGQFADDCFIYGGNVATNKAVGSYASTINGDVSVTVDCGSGNSISLSKITVGSYGWGKINAFGDAHGDTKLVFKGDGTNLVFTENGELWGGCGGDNVSPVTGKCADTEDGCLVAGDRLLSFEGFSSGNFNCKRIRDFRSIRLKGESEVTLTRNTVDLRGLENWTIEKDSSLSGDFANDFAGDTLNLTGFAGFEGTSILMTDLNVPETQNDNTDVFSGFGSLAKIQMGGTDVAASFAGDAWTWSSGDIGYRLELQLDGSTKKMALVGTALSANN